MQLDINLDYSGNALIKVRLDWLAVWLRSAYSTNNVKEINIDGNLNNKNINNTNGGVCPDLPLKNKIYFVKKQPEVVILGRIIVCIGQRNLTLF